MSAVRVGGVYCCAQACTPKASAVASSPVTSRAITTPGRQRIIGVSTHNIAQARQAVDDGADYIGVGPIYPTRTRGYETGVGTAYIREVVAANISLPFFAIGSVNLENLGEVLSAGATRVAVSSAIIGASDISAAAAAFIRGLHGRR